LLKFPATATLSAKGAQTRNATPPEYGTAPMPECWDDVAMVGSLLLSWVIAAFDLVDRMRLPELAAPHADLLRVLLFAGASPIPFILLGLNFCNLFD
jgi:hypothetical protein